MHPNGPDTFIGGVARVDIWRPGTAAAEAESAARLASG